nr:hypothetical protein BN444_03429 [Xanthomonas translucens pv. translucens DSM 18974]
MVGGVRAGDDCAAEERAAVSNSSITASGSSSLRVQRAARCRRASCGSVAVMKHLWDSGGRTSRHCHRDSARGAARVPVTEGRGRRLRHRASGEDASWVSEAVGAEAAPAGLPRPFRGGRNEKRDGRWAIPFSITAGGEVRLSSSDRGFPAAVRRWRPCRGNCGTGWSGRRCCRARGSWRGRCRRSCATGRRSP